MFLFKVNGVIAGWFFSLRMDWGAGIGEGKDQVSDRKPQLSKDPEARELNCASF